MFMREGNILAHCLARNSEVYNDLRVWMEETPMAVLDLVFDEKPA